MTTTIATDRVFRIRDTRLPQFVERFQKLQKRAARLGVGTVSWSEVGREPWVLYEDAREFTSELPADAPMVREGKGRVLGHFEVVLVTVSGDAPRLAGWQLIAVLEHAGEEVGTLLRAVPGTGVEIPERFRHLGHPSCEHCKLNRQRRDTFVVAHEDGRVAQVGRSCLHDFTGWQSPEAIAAFAELLIEAEGLASGEDWVGGGGIAADGFPLLDFLAQTASVIRQKGWLSRTKAREWDRNDATADLVLDAFSRDGRHRADFRATFGDPTDADVADAEAALDWARGLRESGEHLDDYLWNVSVVVLSGPVAFRSAGIAASIVAVFLRRREREIIKRSEAASEAASEWIGEVGQRGTFTFTLLAVQHFEAEYGRFGSDLHTLVDADGNRAKWFASGDSPWHDGRNHEYRIGEARTVKATVKRHDTYRERKETVLSRVALAPEPKPAKAKKVAA